MENVKLDDICIFIRNGANIKNDVSKKGIPITRIETIANGNIDEMHMGYADIFDNKYEGYYLKKNDILMSHINSMKHLGKVAICDEDKKIIHGMNLLDIRLKSEVDAKYLYYFFKSNNFKRKLNKIAKQSVNQSSFSVNDFKKIRISIHEKSEQKDISAKLDKVQEIIDIRKKQFGELDELVKAKFVEMFEKDNVLFERLLIKDAIEKKYIEKPLDGNHGNKHPKVSDYVQRGIPFLMANNMENGNVDLNNCNFITKEQANSLDKGFAKDNDVLITHKGTIGKTAILHTNYEYVMLTPQITYYRTNSRYILPEYLKAYFDSEKFQSKMKNIASSGSTRAYIGITEQQKLELIVPPIEQQLKFVNIANKVNKQKLVLQKSLEETQKLQESLMNKYFGG